MIDLASAATPNLHRAATQLDSASPPTLRARHLPVGECRRVINSAASLRPSPEAATQPRHSARYMPAHSWLPPHGNRQHQRRFADGLAAINVSHIVVVIEGGDL